MKSPPHTREFRNWAPEGVDAFPAIDAEFSIRTGGADTERTKTWENGASWLRRGTCLTVHPGFAAQLAGRTITMLSALLAADRDVARLDRGTTRRENVPDASPAC